MAQAFREGAAFGKFLRLRPEINYTNRFSLENRTACNLPTHARETNAELLRDRTPVGGYTQVLPVQFEKGYVVCFAVACRAPDDDFQHGLEFGRRSADDPKNLRRSRLLFLRLVQFAAKPCGLSFPNLLMASWLS